MKILKVFVIIFSIVSIGIFGASLAKHFFSYDATKPEIVSEMDVIEIPCDYTEEDLMKGLTATDEVDGDITDKIVVGSTSRFIEKGVCDITYTVFDSSNNSASLTRRVKFLDYQSPVFELNAPMVFEENEVSSLTVLDRISAYDMLDKEIKNDILQTNSNIIYSTQGDYEISVEVTNSKGDTSTLSIPVHVLPEGSVNCHIELSDYLVYLNVGDAFDPASYVSKVSDDLGNSLDASALNISSNVDTSKAGVYEVCFDPSALNVSGPMYMTVVVR